MENSRTKVPQPLLNLDSSREESFHRELSVEEAAPLEVLTQTRDALSSNNLLSNQDARDLKIQMLDKHHVAAMLPKKPKCHARRFSLPQSSNSSSFRLRLS